MSEQKKTEESKERVKYSVEVDKLAFNPDAEMKILTSNELCRLTNEYFKLVFADYEGCFFDVTQGNPSIVLVFNHCKHEDGNYYAVDMAGDKKVGNSVLERTRAYDRLVKEGDRYHITEDGKDIIEALLAPRYRGNNGKVNWGNIVSDYVDRPASYYGPANGVQLTRVTGIDPKAICGVLFGKKENGSWIDYGVEVKADLSARNGFGITSPNYIINITKAFNDQISKTYEKLGFGMAGSNIIR